jgi:hypothetical protein
MRTILLSALAMSALAGVASAQINAPSPTELHPSGSLLWPRSDSFSYLRGQGIDKNIASEAVETAAPEGRRVTVDSLRGTAPRATAARTPSGSPVAGRVTEYGYMPSSWTGTWDQWMAHQDACAARYKTYDRSDDKYYYKVGQKTYCHLGLKDVR